MFMTAKQKCHLLFSKWMPWSGPFPLPFISENWEVPLTMLTPYCGPKIHFKNDDSTHCNSTQCLFISGVLSLFSYTSIFIWNAIVLNSLELSVSSTCIKEILGIYRGYLLYNIYYVTTPAAMYVFSSWGKAPGQCDSKTSLLFYKNKNNGSWSIQQCTLQSYFTDIPFIEHTGNSTKIVSLLSCGKFLKTTRGQKDGCHVFYIYFRLFSKFNFLLWA